MPQKLPQIYIVIASICIGKVAWFSVYICGKWHAQYLLTWHQNPRRYRQLAQAPSPARGPTNYLLKKIEVKSFFSGLELELFLISLPVFSVQFSEYIFQRVTKYMIQLQYVTYNHNARIPVINLWALFLVIPYTVLY